MTAKVEIRPRVDGKRPSREKVSVPSSSGTSSRVEAPRTVFEGVIAPLSFRPERPPIGTGIEVYSKPKQWNIDANDENKLSGKKPKTTPTESTPYDSGAGVTDKKSDSKD